MKLLENRKLAWIVCALVIVSSIMVLGGAGLSRERDSVEHIFFSGTEETKARTGLVSLNAVINRAKECALVMASEVQLHLGAENSAAKATQELLLELDASKDMALCYEVYSKLQVKSDELYNAMYAAELSDAEITNFKRAYDNFWGCDKYVRIDPYRNAALKFNDLLRGFPARIAANVMGVRELNSFGL